MSLSDIIYWWLLHSGLISLTILTFGSVAILLCYQPARRLKLIELTLLGCLVSPCLSMIPGYPQLSNGTELFGDLVERKTSAECTSVAPHEPNAIAADSATTSHPSIASLDKSPGQRHHQSLHRGLVAGYLLGVSTEMLWWLFGSVALARIVWSAEDAPAQCREVLRKIAGPRGDSIRLLISSHAKQPFASVGFAVHIPPQRSTWRRAVIVLPRDICSDEIALHWSLAHEWTHIQRHDFRTWFVAGLARSLFFYQPLVWWLRNQLRLCQDYMADAQASRQSEQPEDYAEFLTCRAKAGLLPRAIVGLGLGFQKSELYRRVLMIIQDGSLERKPSQGWAVLIVFVASFLICILPALTIVPNVFAQEFQSCSIGVQLDSPIAKKVNFTIGPHRFVAGCNIIIQEVRSERGTMANGDTIIVQGVYTFYHVPRASLFLGVTQSKRDQGGSNTERQVEAGNEVPFKMALPITCDGHLHLSLYDAKTRESFAAIYFGTYEQMQEIAGWNLNYVSSQKAEPNQPKKRRPTNSTSSTGQTGNDLPLTPLSKNAPSPPNLWDYKKVDFALGPQRFDKGSNIAIQEVLAKLGTLDYDDDIIVRGTYSFQDRSSATLLLSVTTDGSDPNEQDHSVQLKVDAGEDVPFEFVRPIRCNGRLHVGLYDCDTGKPFGNVYFGVKN